MRLPLQITIRDIPTSRALENHLRRKLEKLSRLCDKITFCRAVVDVPQKHKHQGKLFNVRIDISVPKDEIVINRIKDQDVYVAIRNAIKAAKRKLTAYTRKLKGNIKNHEPILRGKIVRLFPNEDYGFIQSFEGTELYFNRMNVAFPNFDQLEVGTEVQFLVTFGNEGAQANRVSASKHNLEPSIQEN